jgi:hypothetical protein
MITTKGVLIQVDRHWTCLDTTDNEPEKGKIHQRGSQTNKAGGDQTEDMNTDKYMHNWGTRWAMIQGLGESRRRSELSCDMSVPTLWGQLLCEVTTFTKHWLNHLRSSDP